MTSPRPAVSLRHRLTVAGIVTIRESQACIAGRVMWWRGQKLLGYGNIADAGDLHKIPRGADTVSLAAAADFAALDGEACAQ